MKIYKLNIILLACSIAFLTSTATFSQSVTQPEASAELTEAARELTEMWEEELSLTAKQMAIMEDKFIEFQFKKNKILQSKMREKAKSRQLLKLEELENRDMRDILTQPQYDRYIMLKERMTKKDKTEY